MGFRPASAIRHGRRFVIFLSSYFSVHVFVPYATRAEIAVRDERQSPCSPRPIFVIGSYRDRRIRAVPGLAAGSELNDFVNAVVPRLQRVVT